MSDLPDMPSEAKIIAAHMAATAAAFQVLVTALQEAGALQPGTFPEMLRPMSRGFRSAGTPIRWW